jgi:hypothetical protein
VDRLEKSRLRAHNNRRLEQVTGKLHCLVDSEDLEHIDALTQAIASLTTEQEVTGKTPKWPWAPGSPRVLTTAVLLPIVVFLLPQLLERVVLL